MTERITERYYSSDAVWFVSPLYLSLVIFTNNYGKAKDVISIYSFTKTSSILQYRVCEHDVSTYLGNIEADMSAISDGATAFFCLYKVIECLPAIPVHHVTASGHVCTTTKVRWGQTHRQWSAENHAKSESKSVCINTPMRKLIKDSGN